MRIMRKLYVFAGILTVIVYVAGIMTGWTLADVSSESFEKNLNRIKIDLESAQQELLLLSARDVAGCAVITSLSTDITNRLNKAANDLTALENQGQSQTSPFTDLKRSYIELSVRAWILRSALNKNCAETVLPILYYYSVPCDDCAIQGRILDEVRPAYGDKVAVYVVDRNFNHTLVSTLATSHEISRTPALVIGEHIEIGLVDAEKLNDLLCEGLNLTACPEVAP